ncbi:TetR/AcrR family transcriptional regulator [Gemmata sp. JC717]|uniref:TetR/AcrR family transcriptional regulator n=1 Tax=Gemmata algarum TaxID=2975278 RepID=A0ABU5FBI1_9BACT|nr:TetR/AcrR family transcriptional regulator [Gemmata algarum]MDY3554147.1 TetR/AcrR family transcriptional regulator [Gemmata algarum]MDY3563186.1 TetR/AcrR family transcriptional regulator [Gemmata algarum]
MARTKPTADARERILEAADRLFYRDGVRATGVDTVIAAAGVAKMTLYAHFKSKDELIAAYLRHRSEHVCTWFASAVVRYAEQSGDWLDAIFAALKEWFHTPDFRGCAFINATAELPDPSHPGRTAIDEHARRFTAAVADALKKAGVNDAATVATAVTMLIDGAIVAAARDGASDSADQAFGVTRTLLQRV